MRATSSLVGYVCDMKEAWKKFLSRDEFKFAKGYSYLYFTLKVPLPPAGVQALQQGGQVIIEKLTSILSSKQVECCVLFWARHFTLTIPLSPPQENLWVLADYLGKYMWEGGGGVGASYKQWIGILFVKYQQHSQLLNATETR